MSHQDPLKIDPEENKVPQVQRTDIQTALNRLEEAILASFRIPLTRKTLIDEETILEMLDQIRFSLPSVFQEAQAVVEQKQEILLQGEQHAQEIIQAAEAKALQLLNETTIVRQSEAAAQEIRQQVEHDCIAMQQQVQAEIDQMRRQAQAELLQIRASAIAEAEDIQNGADEYADSVLRSIEQQLNDMLRIIRNGRQQLYPPAKGSGVRDEG